MSFKIETFELACGERETEDLAGASLFKNTVRVGRNMIRISQPLPKYSKSLAVAQLFKKKATKTFLPPRQFKIKKKSISRNKNVHVHESKLGRVLVVPVYTSTVRSCFLVTTFSPEGT